MQLLWWWSFSLDRTEARISSVATESLDPEDVKGQLQGRGDERPRPYGAGYPDGLSGERIPLCARIFAVADTLDAMTTDRPYRNALSWDDAAEEIVSQSGHQFDPGIVDAFAAAEPRLREIYDGLSLVA